MYCALAETATGGKFDAKPDLAAPCLVRSFPLATITLHRDANPLLSPSQTFKLPQLQEQLRSTSYLDRPADSDSNPFRRIAESLSASFGRTEVAKTAHSSPQRQRDSTISTRPESD